MTTITHTADGPRFDGMTVKSLADDLHQMALRHLSEWQPIETQIAPGPDGGGA